jgi:signal transduction histidine kinase/AmiR/NasT family two-component response regulator
MQISLRWRILLLTFIVVGSVSLLGLFVVISERIEATGRMAHQDARSLSLALVPMLQNSLVTGDLATVQQTFADIVKQEAVRRIVLFNPVGADAIIEAVDTESTAAGLPPSWFGALLGGGNWADETAISVGGVTYGRLRLEMSDTTIQRDLWTSILRFIAVGSISMVAIVALLALLLNWGLAPLESLLASTRRMESGDTTARVPRVTVPEFDQVAMAFNEMAERIVARESDLIHARDAAQAAGAAKAAFLATMSHEIRTPMNGIIGMTDLALTTPLNEEQRGYLEVVKDSADNLLVIINDILDYSKIDAGRLTLEAVPLDLQRLVPQIMALFSSKAHDRQVQLKAELAPDLPLLIGDPTRLRQILINLLGNAVKFTHAGAVTLRIVVLERAGTQCALRFEVVDTGIGIPPEKQSSIFDPFSQADTSTTRNYGGTGLGLAICGRLVRLMGGELSVASSPGEGSNFSFVLSLPVTSERRNPQREQMVPRHVGSGFHILVAEDVPTNQLVARTLLTKHGYQVTIAGDGVHAVEAFIAGRFDAVLMDMQMPRLDGIAATARIREFEVSQSARDAGERRVPIIALTANAFAEDRQRCLNAGMDDFLSKPFKADEVFATLDRHLAPGRERIAATS